VNVMGVAHGTDKSLVLAHKAAIDEHLKAVGIPVSYTNVFWGGRSESNRPRFPRLLIANGAARWLLIRIRCANEPYQYKRANGGVGGAIRTSLPALSRRPGCGSSGRHGRPASVKSNHPRKSCCCWRRWSVNPSPIPRGGDILKAGGLGIAIDKLNPITSPADGIPGNHVLAGAHSATRSRFEYRADLVRVSIGNVFLKVGPVIMVRIQLCVCRIGVGEGMGQFPVIRNTIVV